MVRTVRQSVLATSLVLAAASHAFAGELVFNGGFETGNFSGWSVPPNVGPGHPNSALFRVVTGGNPHSGNHWAGMASAQLRFMSQVLPTQAGEDYELSFWLRHPGNASSRFVIRWEGQTIYDNFLLQLPDGDNWHRLSFPLHSNITGSLLEFGQQEFPIEWHIDDISVQVPAPGAATVLVMGGAVALRRGRRS